MLGALSKMSRTWLESERINRNIFNTEDRPPQCIAHRGFKLKFPENSELAFREAVKHRDAALPGSFAYLRSEQAVLDAREELVRYLGRPELGLGSR